MTRHGSMLSAIGPMRPVQYSIYNHSYKISHLNNLKTTKIENINELRFVEINFKLFWMMRWGNLSKANFFSSKRAYRLFFKRHGLGGSPKVNYEKVQRDL